MAGFRDWRESGVVMNPTSFSMCRSSLGAVSLLWLGLTGHAAAIDSVEPVSTLTPTNPTGSLSGNAVAMNENYILVGAPGDSLPGGMNQGAVDVYHARTRAFIRRLRGVVPLNGERFGSKVAILRNTAYIGAPGRGAFVTAAGGVYAFDIPTGRRLWIHEGLSSNEAAGGAGLAVAGEYLAVGLPDAYASNGSYKAGYVRLLNHRTGVEAGVIEAPAPETDDNCGAALAGYGCMLAVGVPFADEEGTNSGMVMLVDVRKPGFPKNIVSNGSVQKFGISVALQDGYLAAAHHYGVVVTRLTDLMQAQTLGGSQIGNNWAVTMTGDVVIFGESSSGAGGQVFAYDMAGMVEPYAINVAVGQQRLSFGRSLAAFGGSLVVGDGSVPNSYVYDLPAINWAPAKTSRILSTNGTAVGVIGQYAKINGYTMNTSGKVAAVAELKGTGITPANRVGAWNNLSGSLDLLARTGDVWGGAKLTGVSPALLNNSARGLILGKLSGTGADVILEDNSMVLAEIVREGATINGGKKLLRLDEVVQPDMSGATGRATAAGMYRVGVAGVTAANDSAIFSTSMIATFGEVAREGNLSPVGAGVNYGQILPRVARPVGNVAFCSTLTGAGVTSANNLIIVRNVISTGTNKIIARKGDTAPGALGAKFSAFVGENASQNGSVMFRALLSGASTTNNEGIWVTDNDGNNLQLAARKGSPAPFMPPGVTFSRFIKTHQCGTGALFIMAAVRGTGVTTSNDLAIWFYERTTGFILISREGERAAGAGGARLGTFQNFEAEPNETFILAASLTECSTAINQGLFMGRASVGAAIRRTQPHLQVRKGSRYVRNGSPVVSSLSFPNTADKAGFTNKGRGNVVAYERAAFKLQAADGTSDLMAGGL